LLLGFAWHDLNEPVPNFSRDPSSGFGCILILLRGRREGEGGGEEKESRVGGKLMTSKDMFLAMFIWSLLAWFIDNVRPGEHGSKKPI
jgi:hypothetical protein